MKIRAVCYFITGTSIDEIQTQVRGAIQFFKDALSRLKELGMPVQMVRFATNSFEEYLPANSGESEIRECMSALDNLCREVSASLDGVACIMSIGDVRRYVQWIPMIMVETESLFANLSLGLSAGAEPLPAVGPLSGSPDLQRAMECADAVLALARQGGEGDGLIKAGPLTGMPFCFKCTVTARLEPGTPFFPGAMSRSAAAPDSEAAAWRAPGFAFATENSDLVASAFSKAEAAVGLDGAREALRKEMEEALAPLEELGQGLHAAHPRVAYVGIDPSIATAAAPEHSVVRTWADLLKSVTTRPGRRPPPPSAFGGPGTLAVSAAVTAALKSLRGVTTCGYAGLMLPQTEDDGLARAASRGELSLSGLLLNSAVCGTGLDTVVIPGDTEPTELGLLYADVATLAHRLGKPLACRVWPAPGRSAGQPVHFKCPFFVDSAALPVRPSGTKAAACPSPKLGKKSGDGLVKRPAARGAAGRRPGAKRAGPLLKRPAARAK